MGSFKFSYILSSVILFLTHLSIVTGDEINIQNLISSVAGGDHRAAEKCYSYYLKKVIRPEAAYYWGNVAIFLGSRNVTAVEMEKIRETILRSDFEDFVNPDFVRHLQKLRREKNYAELRSFLILSSLPEEALFWILQGKREKSIDGIDRFGFGIAKTDLKLCEQGIFGDLYDFWIENAKAKEGEKRVKSTNNKK